MKVRCFLVTLAIACSILSVSSLSARAQNPETLYNTGVTAYQQGHFQQALPPLQQLITQAPDHIEGHYYTAITLAQLGRFADAKREYETVIKLAPSSDAATLAKQGLDYLPKNIGLAQPPRFDVSPQTPAATSATTSAAAAPGMDSKAMQMMMLMSAMGGGNNSNSLMMLPMMQKMMGGGDSKDSKDDEPMFDPQMMSTMMQNQMMQNFNPFSSGDKDR